jgi:hypothetical protein
MWASNLRRRREKGIFAFVLILVQERQMSIFGRGRQQLTWTWWPAVLFSYPSRLLMTPFKPPEKNLMFITGNGLHFPKTQVSSDVHQIFPFSNKIKLFFFFNFFILFLVIVAVYSNYYYYFFIWFFLFFFCFWLKCTNSTQFQFHRYFILYQCN